MRVVLGADHAGYLLKEELKSLLEGLAYDVVDVGTKDPSPVDYPDIARDLGRVIRDGGAERGILICGSGVGASIAANKLSEIRAGLCHDTYSAHQGVEHDDMNVLVLGARVIGPESAKECVKAFLGADFSGDARHARRLAKLKEMEKKEITGGKGKKG
jgi:RpiB/LacA/LacB family sugar-phosphate isomerase